MSCFVNKRIVAKSETDLVGVFKLTVMDVDRCLALEIACHVMVL